MMRMGGAEALGPILMGLSKPVHVLERGSGVEEIVNMAAIAVVHAQVGVLGSQVIRHDRAAKWPEIPCSEENNEGQKEFRSITAGLVEVGRTCRSRVGLGGGSASQRLTAAP